MWINRRTCRRCGVHDGRLGLGQKTIWSPAIIVRRLTIRASFSPGVGIGEGHASRLAGHSTAVSRRHYVRSVTDPLLERTAHRRRKNRRSKRQKRVETKRSRRFQPRPKMAQASSLTHLTARRRLAWQWRRGELNPCPKITRMKASTCLGGRLLSSPATRTVTLRGGSDVCFSPPDLRRNPAASPHFAAGVTRASTPCRGCLQLGSHDNRGGKADSACNIVVGS